MIQTDGAVLLTVTANNADVVLANAGNRIAAAVVLSEATAGFLRDFSLRNAADDAAPPGTGRTTRSAPPAACAT